MLVCSLSCNHGMPIFCGEMNKVHINAMNAVPAQLRRKQQDQGLPAQALEHKKITNCRI